MAEVSKIDYKLGQDNVQLLGLDIHNPVFVVSSLTIIAFVSGVLVFQAGAAAAFGALRAWLMSTFDWVFMSAGNLFVLFCLMLVVTPLGRVRLGGADARMLVVTPLGRVRLGGADAPDYSRSAWFAMLFAAGIACRVGWSPRISRTPPGFELSAPFAFSDTTPRQACAFSPS